MGHYSLGKGTSVTYKKFKQIKQEQNLMYYEDILSFSSGYFEKNTLVIEGKETGWGKSIARKFSLRNIETLINTPKTERKITTKFTLLEDDELVADCSCNNKGLCQHIMNILYVVANSEDDVLDYLDVRYLENELKVHGFLNKISFEALLNTHELSWDFKLDTLQIQPLSQYKWLSSTVERPKISIEEEKKYVEQQYNLNEHIAITFDVSEQKSYKVLLQKGKANKRDPLRLAYAKPIDITEFGSELKNYDIPLQTFQLLLQQPLPTNTYHHYNYDQQYHSIYDSDEQGAFCEFLKSLRGFKRLFLGKSVYHSFKELTPVKVSEDTFQITYEFKKDKEGYVVNPYYVLPDQKIKVTKKTPKNDLYTPAFILVDGTIYLPENIIDSIQLNHNFSEGQIKIEKEILPIFLEKFFPQIADKTVIKGVVKKEINVQNTALKYEHSQLYLSESDDFISFTPRSIYEGNIEVNPVVDDTVFSSYQDNKLSLQKRDKEAEQVFLQKVQELHPKFANQDTSFFHLDYQEFVDSYWFLQFTEALNEANIELFGIKELKRIKYALHRPVVSINVESGIDWFDTEINVTIGDEVIGIKELKKQLLKNHNYIKLSDGKHAVLPEEWLTKIKKYLRLGQVSKEGKLQISKQRFNALSDLEEEGFLSPEILQEIQEKKEQLRNFKEIKNVPIPTDINAELRSYQQEGFHWLCFLEEYGWGGILADDMGLGKTLQALTYIQHKKNQGIKKPILVVAPTSLLINWQKEIEKFTPSLNSAMHYGIKRDEIKKIAKGHDLVITSYGVLVNEIEKFKKEKFELIILDESQAVKNVNSQRYKAVLSLKADQKLALSGTPIENNTFELFAQLNFANKGLLGTPSEFKSNYSVPIDTKGDQKVSQELQQMISPFVLRRTKETVATELPDKTENILYCEFGTEQQKVYDAFRNEMRNSLLKKIEDEGIERNTMMFLQALTKLRQICNSPSLLSEKDYTSESVKIDTLLTHIKEKTGKHKILVFSQFVSMLSLISKALDKEEISYTSLSGKMTQKQRTAAVNEFQENEDTRVFLISIKAGGTGLNLTEADYVYIVDPWWNPAVENQAIDRCYRIGQTKNVMVYRMICKNTIEEKIMDLKSKKSGISSNIISTDDAIMKKISSKNISLLFE